jgi:hypothetical protein
MGIEKVGISVDTNATGFAGENHHDKRQPS